MSDERAKHIEATEFTTDCLRILNEVSQNRSPVIITRDGKPL
jgi:hypothetical protein